MMELTLAARQGYPCNARQPISVVLLIHKRVPIQWRSTASYGHSRRVSTVQVSQVQEKWAHSHGKQNHQCHDCGRQFVQCFEQYLLSNDKRALIERLLLERISLRGICRAVGIGLKWLLGFLVQRFEALPDHLHVQPVTCYGNVMSQRLEVEADEMASFVQKKANKQWIWIAMDAKSRQVMTFHVGDRSHRSAKRLWAKIPEAYRQHAIFYTDQYVVC
jgi:insertion element IS1 protein InsB